MMQYSCFNTYQPQLFVPEMQMIPYFCYLQGENIFAEFNSFSQNVMQAPTYLASMEHKESAHENGQTSDSSFHSETEETPQHNRVPKLKKFSAKNDASSKFKYPKKNAESNVINQIFSFVSIKGKSKKILERIFSGNQSKITAYYELMKQIKKKNKKYINRSYIKDLMEMEPDHIIHSLLKKVENQSQLNVEEMRKAVRILVSYYMRTIFVPTILTSVKLDKQTMSEHLQRRRDVFEFLQAHLKVWSNN